MKTALAIAALSLVATSACKHAKPDTTPQPVATPTNTAPPSRPTNTSASQPMAPDNTGISMERANAIRATITEPVYFAYDSEQLSADAKSLLERKYNALAANGTVRIRIEGHADERGSDEYNLALGQRRAEAAKYYLVTRGIDASRISTVSYGEERPAVVGSNEAAWAKNRRAEFVITAGEITVGQN
jgi:peptidoglycan-associated lipoprotein